MRAILDTDTVSYIWRYHNPRVASQAARYLIQDEQFTTHNTTHFSRISGLNVIDWTV
jgi:predicted nucleic acid-binding protein